MEYSENGAGAAGEQSDDEEDDAEEENRFAETFQLLLGSHLVPVVAAVDAEADARANGPPRRVHRGFEDAFEQRRIRENTLGENGFQTIIEAIAAADDADTLGAVLVDDRVFEGLRNADQVYETVKQQILEAFDSADFHDVVAHDPHFDLRTVTSSPIAEACISIGLARGQNPECLLQALDANVGYMEAPRTKITHDEKSRHYITTNQACLIGSASSSRKSDMASTTNQWMQRFPAAPAHVASSECFMNEATTKGIRACLREFQEAAVTSDEATNTIKTPWTDEEANLNLMSRAKLNTFTQCEADRVATGHGRMVLENYAFLFKVWGQREIVEWILTPQVHGFQKRMGIAWEFDDLEPDPDVDADAPYAMMDGLHAWMWTYQRPVEQELELDGFALTVYEAVKRAIVDVLALRKNKMGEAYKTKLKFAHSDILRAGHKAFRYNQFLTAIYASAAAAKEETPPRTQLNVEEMLLGVRRWLRRLKLHFAYYRYCRDKRAIANYPTATARSPKETSVPHGLETPDPQSNIAAALVGIDLVKQAILERASPVFIFSGSDLHDLLRSKKAAIFKKNLSDNIRQACEALIEKGLLVEVESLATPKTKKPRVNDNCSLDACHPWKFTARAEKIYNGLNSGKATALFHKCKVGAFENGAADTEERLRLRVALTHFPA